jgi:hypothetical protein
MLHIKKHAEKFVDIIEEELLPYANIYSADPDDPIVVADIPDPWQVIGTGNFAAVLCHPDYKELVVKFYAPGRPGLKAEARAYRKIGRHQAYSECYYVGNNYLVLKRIYGQTLFDCFKNGIYIPEQVIKDIEKALKYARGLGLFPHDVHGKNVMVVNGRGVVVDISDFYKKVYCPMWRDLKKAYYKFYLPLFSRYCVKMPFFVLETLRKGYRVYRKIRSEYD